MKTSALDVATRAAVIHLGRRMDHGGIVLHEGDTQILLGRSERPLHVRVHDRRFYGTLRRGSIGLGEAYLRGWWDSDDLTEVIRLLIRNLSGARRVLDRLGAVARPLLDPPARLRRSDKRIDRRNIRAHYDIGDDFYALMLDTTMTYSCGLFEQLDMSLAQAQTAKLDRICLKLALSPTDHILEIGSGWGSFALHAASTYGCRVTSTTISAAQHEYATRRIADSGLADRVTVLDADYRDLTGTYDKLVSIEMLEAVNWRDHATFFGRCARLLRPDGLAAIQAIVIADASFERAKRHDDFIRRSIFPGGCLPSITSIAAASSGAGLRMVDLEDIGLHYAETLRRWRLNLRREKVAVATLGFDPEFCRLWDLYLAYCEAAFLERHITDVQVVMAMPEWRDSLTTGAAVSRRAPRLHAVGARRGGATVT